MATNAQDIESLLQQVHEKKGNTEQKIEITQEIFSKIQASLAETIDSMGRNPSFFSRIATFWHALPLWQRILIGIALILPPLVIGLAIPLSIISGIFLATAFISALFYGLGSLLLGDHHKRHINITDALKKGVLSLANFLEQTIKALHSIREDLEQEIDRLAGENQRLSQIVNELNNLTEQLQAEVLSAQTTIASLHSIEEKLETTTTTLEQQIAAKERLLEDSQAQLERITTDYQKSQTTLAEEITKFNAIKEALGKDLSNTNLLVKTLHEVTNSFSQIVLADEQQQAAFKERIEHFLHNKQESLDKLVTRIFDSEKKLAETEEKLADTQRKLEALGKEYGSHNTQHEVLLDKLEKEVKRITHQTPENPPLRSIGYFATPPVHHLDLEGSRAQEQNTASPQLAP